MQGTEPNEYTKIVDYEPIPQDPSDSTKGIYDAFINDQKPVVAPKKVEEPKPVVKVEPTRIKTGIASIDPDDINADAHEESHEDSVSAYAEFAAANAVVGTPDAAEEASKISPITIENEKPKPVEKPVPEAEPSAFA